jgi:hypothetical protein
MQVQQYYLNNSIHGSMTIANRVFEGGHPMRNIESVITIHLLTYGSSTREVSKLPLVKSFAPEDVDVEVLYRRQNGAFTYK